MLKGIALVKSSFVEACQKNLDSMGLIEKPTAIIPLSSSFVKTCQDTMAECEALQKEGGESTPPLSKDDGFDIV